MPLGGVSHKGNDEDIGEEGGGGEDRHGLLGSSPCRRPCPMDSFYKLPFCPVAKIHAYQS